MTYDAAVTVACARCSFPMTLVSLGQAMAYGCVQCGAVLLTHDHAQRVKAGIDRAAAQIAERAAFQKPRIDQTKDSGPLSCPVCHMVMQREWQHGQSIRLDTCPTHGVFFDAHELIAMVPEERILGMRPGFQHRSMGDTVVDLISQLLSGG